MARYRFRMQRLFVDHPLIDGDELMLDKAQSNYLVNVLRMKQEDPVLIFNGRDGEFEAALASASKKAAQLRIGEKLRSQPEPSSLHYLFAPLKQARLDYMVQKAVEMGVGCLRPVITDHTQVSKLNLDRVRANVVEAAEQCGILSIPDVIEPLKLTTALAEWPEEGRKLIFCDEGDEGDDPVSILQAAGDDDLAILIGPEGGFSDKERDYLKKLPFVISIPLGPRILRADTAAVAALAVVQAVKGDWA